MWLVQPVQSTVKCTVNVTPSKLNPRRGGQLRGVPCTPRRLQGNQAQRALAFGHLHVTHASQ